MINRFKRDARLKIYLMSNSSITDEETPRLHRKNEKWQLPRAIRQMDVCLKASEDNANQETRKNKHLRGSNLTELQ